MHVGDAVARFGQRSQFEVVRGEQGVGAVVVGQMARAGLGQGQAVVGRGAAADLVHQHQRAVAGVVQDVAGLAHLDHEGRLAAGEVVAGADAGEDAVDRADHGARRRHETADMREQHDQRVLPHISRLTAHVRAGDDQHAAAVAVVEHQIVGLERILAHRLDHRMAAAQDAQARRFGELGFGPVQAGRAFGERAQHVEFRQGRGAALERFQAFV
ncbi:hypothetical protein CATMIT_01653 [Catenibacterium mitsuokai DSM 15897]|nr:hypothetical protein CATMIT_01653 [Catenibacterium mitsuokai DSM 15897]